MEDYKDKICPFIYNEDKSGYHINCIGSKCMAWGVVQLLRENTGLSYIYGCKLIDGQPKEN